MVEHDDSNTAVRRTITLEPAHYKPDAVGRQRRAEAKRMTWPNRLLLFLAVLGALLVVVYWLPQQRAVQTAPPTTLETSPSPKVTFEPAAMEPPEETIEVDESARAAQRTATQQLLDGLLAKIETLKKKSVTQWAAADFAKLDAARARGEQAYAEQRYQVATQAYQQAEQIADALLAHARELAQQEVATGEQALANLEAKMAEKAFIAALNIDPTLSAAQQGLARARTLDRVVALVTEAEGHERVGDINQALRAYREAATLDPQYDAATAAVTRLTTERAEARYRDAMSTGYAALERQAFAAARSAFKQAATHKPDAPEPQRALSEVTARESERRLANALQAARSAERNERWGEAIAQLRKAQKIDPDLAGIGARLATAQRRASLMQEFDEVLRDPSRLQNQKVYAAADALRQRAGAITDPGPQLSQRRAQLQQALTAARTAVTLLVHSDNETQVTIYKVGTLGRFAQRQLALYPGRYTAVGRRTGYRDVRVEFELSARDPAPRVEIRCVERIGG